MNRPRIIVTGATGKTGSVVVAELLNYDPYMIQGAVAFAVAAKESRLEQIVGLSQWLASPSHPSLATRQSWLVDRLFSMTPGVAHTIINPGFFADAYLVTIGLAVHLGTFPWMYGNSRNAPPSNEDIARVAVGVLLDPARHAGRSYRPTGPELLGANDMAKMIGRAVGRSVKVVPTPTWLFMKAARTAGMSIDLMSNVRYYVDDHKRGAFELGTPRSPLASISIGTTVNCAARSHSSRSSRPSPRSGSASTLSATLPSLQRQSTTRPLLLAASLNGWNLNRRNLCKRKSLFSSASHSA